jgi:hypothetical protein
MSFQVVMGAQMVCTGGTGPSNLVVLPEGVPVMGPTFAATIMDCKPIVNIPPFFMCQSPRNPAVVAAKVPVPCVPVTTPWVPGAPLVLINGNPALTSSSKCNCAWGEISVVTPGQTKVMLPG